jgi:hypothetical protein
VRFEALLIAMFTALAAWTWRLISKSFGALPALSGLTLCGVFLICAAMIGVLGFITDKSESGAKTEKLSRVGAANYAIPAKLVWARTRQGTSKISGKRGGFGAKFPIGYGL